MKVDYLIAEIGSTTTLVTAFNLRKTSQGEAFMDISYQGKSYTTVLEGDVTIGLNNAIRDIEVQAKEELRWDRMLATSSAAGGLRITVHGLMERMTVKAAKEAALGAGGIIKMVTSGKIRNSDLKRIREIQPNLIMIAGGTDYGERDTALYNAELIRAEDFKLPVVYCGNVENQEEIKEIFKGQELYIVDNVYPNVDELNVEPARKVIQEVFEKNIIKAPGMETLKNLVKGPIMPTPGAVMESAKILYDLIGDLIVFDVGGATTDLHSVTEGNNEILELLLSPEPKAKRTVEGDLGVYVNSKNLIDLLDIRDLGSISKEAIEDNIKAIPVTEAEIRASKLLTKKAVDLALERHAGKLKRRFGGEGGFMAWGKDLSQVKYIIGTGGALTRLPGGKETLENIRFLKDELTMLPGRNTKVLLDNDYIMACAGVLSRENREAAELLLKKSLRL